MASDQNSKTGAKAPAAAMTTKRAKGSSMYHLTTIGVTLLTSSDTTSQRILDTVAAGPGSEKANNRRNKGSADQPNTKTNGKSFARVSGDGAVSKVTASSVTRKRDAFIKLPQVQRSPSVGSDSEDDPPFKRPTLIRDATKEAFEQHKKDARNIKKSASPQDIYQGRLTSFTDLDKIKDEMYHIQHILSCCKGDSRFLMSPFVNSLEAEYEELRTFEETLQARNARLKTTNEEDTITGNILYESTRDFRGVGREVFRLRGSLPSKKIVAKEVGDLAKTFKKRAKDLKGTLAKEEGRGDTDAVQRIQCKLTAADMCGDLIEGLHTAINRRTSRLHTFAGTNKATDG
ncbi:hypothetical protein PRZ48_010473 [Zasmidium cellare]|uniref:Uncharacterized protein n=1 Tax=Zasmidium cellare TaxID=395010 RepID=A0ABR0E931_ZASCE|nr:hypothetical protein PRZ48_010473 [Zasmidium cellare]